MREALFIYYGYQYAVYRESDNPARFQIIRESMNTEACQSVRTDNESLFQYCDTMKYEELLRTVADRVELDTIKKKRRANLQAIRKLFD